MSLDICRVYYNILHHTVLQHTAIASSAVCHVQIISLCHLSCMCHGASTCRKSIIYLFAMTDYRIHAHAGCPRKGQFVTWLVRVTWLSHVCDTTQSVLEGKAKFVTKLSWCNTHCTTLHHTATHCSALQHTRVYPRARAWRNTHCSILHPTVTHCNALQHTRASPRVRAGSWQSWGVVSWSTRANLCRCFWCLFVYEYHDTDCLIFASDVL